MAGTSLAVVEERMAGWTKKEYAFDARKRLAILIYVSNVLNSIGRLNPHLLNRSVYILSVDCIIYIIMYIIFMYLCIYFIFRSTQRNAW